LISFTANSHLLLLKSYIELVLSQKTEDDTQMFQVLLWGMRVDKDIIQVYKLGGYVCIN